MVPKQRNRFWFAAIVIPGYESNRCMKVVLFHLLEQALVAEVPVRLPQPWIVNGQVGVVMDGVPALFSSAVPHEHHYRSDFQELGGTTFDTPVNGAIARRMHIREQEDLLLVEIDLNEY